MYKEAVYTATVERSGYKHEIELYIDDNAEDPRDWENVCTFALSMKRYNLSNEFDWLNFNDYGSFAEVLEAVLERENIVGYLAVYGYSHGGLALSLSNSGQFSCPWDSGQVGYIFVTEESIKKNFPDLPQEEWEEKTYEFIESEFKLYSAYISGDTYCYVVKGNLVEDSCCGFYSVEDAIEYAKSEIDAFVDATLKEQDSGALIHELFG